MLSLRPHSRSGLARVWRNSVRLGRGRPPLFDRYSGYESQLVAAMRSERYRLGVVEHFWCASYAPLLRSRCDRLVLDLHNIESTLARTHAHAARWPASGASARFAGAYARLEREWFPRFDVILVASEEDRTRVKHPDVRVFPNALPVGGLRRPLLPRRTTRSRSAEISNITPTSRLSDGSVHKDLAAPARTPDVEWRLDRPQPWR